MRAEEVVTGPTNRMVIAVLALVGIFVTFYLVAHNLGWTGPIVCGVGDCGTVQSSEWAHIGPIPVSAIGLVGYVGFFILALVGLQPNQTPSKVIPVLLLAGSGFGVLFSAWLSYLEAVVIHAWCQYCVGSAIIITLIFLASLPEIRRVREGTGGRAES